MDAKTKTALVNSIARWKSISQGNVESGDCPLCDEFVSQGEARVPCVGCPLYEAGQVCGEIGSLYDSWRLARARLPRITWGNRREQKRENIRYMEATKNMLNFLEDLLETSNT